MDKKKLFALLIFLIMGFFMVSFANPSDQLRPVDTDTKEETPVNNNANQTNVTPTRRTTTDTRTNQTIADNTTPVQNNDATTDTTPVENPTEDGTGNVSVTEYTVLFVDYANNILKSQTVEEHASATADDIQVASYTAANITYSFAKWDKDFSDVTSNLTVKAVYDVEKIIAHVYINGKETDETVEIKVNDDTKNKKDVDLTDNNIDDYIANKDELPDVKPGKENEVDKLTYDEEEGYIVEINETNIDYTITATNGALVNGKEETIAHIGDEVTLSHIDKDGYEFVNYMVQDGDTVYFTEDTTITVNTDDITVTAVYSTVTYKIEYVLNGGVFPEEVEIPREYTVESDDITLVNPTMVGYNFIGWTINNSNPSTTVVIKKGSTGDRVYTAHFQARTDIKYTVERYTEKLNYTSDEDKYEYLDTIEYNNGTADKEKEIRVDAIEGFTTPASKKVTIAADGSTVVRFNYDRVQRTVTFKVNDKVYGEVQTLKYGAAITVPTYNVAQGYTFSGWGNVAATMGTENLVYKATYTANTNTKYTVIINEEDTEGNYTTTRETRTGKTDDTITVTVPNKTGFTVDANSKDVKIKGDESAEVEFTYTRVQRKLKFTVNTTEVVKEETLRYGADIIVPDFTVAAGYTFSRWTNVASTMGTTDLTYNATYTANTNTKYTIEKYLENTNVTENTPVEQRYTKVNPDVTDTYTTDEELTINAPEVEGFTATQSSITQKIAGDESTVYRFYYNRNTVSVTFNYYDNNEEGNIVRINKVEITKYGEGVNVPTPATGFVIDGYEYKFANKWLTKVDNSDVEYTNFSEVTESVLVNAKYTTNAYGYTISYTLNGGSATNPDKYTIETETFKLNNPTKANYDFIGWTGSNGTTPQKEVTIEKGSTGNKNYTANYTAKEYTITYVYNGGTLAEGQTNPENYTVESSDITLNNPSKEGYTFDGWYEKINNEDVKVEVITTGTTGNKTLTAKYTPISYKITYNLDGGQLAQGKTNPNIYTVEDLPLTINSPSKTGYNFTNWTDQDGNTYTTSLPENTTGTKTLTANYTAKEYTITYVYNGGTLAEGQTNPEKYTVESSDITLNNPSKEGYTFDGWYEKVNNKDVKVEVITTGTTGNKTLTAKYTPISYNITYNLDGGTGVSNRTYTIETPTFTLPKPTKANYAFAGWTGSNGNVAQKDVTITQGTTGDKNYTATWTRQPSDISINTTITGNKPAQYGDELTLTVTIKNNGADSGSVKLSDSSLKQTLVDDIEAFSVVSASITGQTDVDGLSLINNGYTLENIPAGQTVTITLKLKVTGNAGSKIETAFKAEPTYGDTKQSTKQTVRIETTVSFVKKTERIVGTNIVLLIDESGSMGYDTDTEACDDAYNNGNMDYLNKNCKSDKFKNAKEAAKNFLDTVFSSTNSSANVVVSVYKFGTYCGLVSCRKDAIEIGTARNANEMNDLKNSINALDDHPYASATPYDKAFEKAYNKLYGWGGLANGNNNNNVVIFLTDGAPDEGHEGYYELQYLYYKKTVIYSIGYGIGKNSNEFKTLKNISENSGTPDHRGKAFTSDTGLSDLNRVFNTIYSDIKQESQVLTVEGVAEIESDIIANKPITINVTDKDGHKKPELKYNTLQDALNSGYIVRDGIKYDIDAKKFKAGDKIEVIFFGNGE